MPHSDDDSPVSDASGESDIILRAVRGAANNGAADNPQRGVVISIPSSSASRERAAAAARCAFAERARPKETEGGVSAGTGNARRPRIRERYPAAATEERARAYIRTPRRHNVLEAGAASASQGRHIQRTLCYIHASTIHYSNVYANLEVGASRYMSSRNLDVQLIETATGRADRESVDAV